MEKLINDFKICFTKGDTYALAVKFKNIKEDLRLAYFTVKENADDAPLIQKALGAGITKIDDREYKDEKTYKVQLQSEDTLNLEPLVQYLYDLRVTIDNVVKTVLSGVFVVTHTVAGQAGTTAQDIEVAIDDEVSVEAQTTPATNGIEYEQDPVANAKIGDLTALNTTAKQTIVQAINEVRNGVLSTDEAVDKILNGTTEVPKADKANSATTAGFAQTAGSAQTAENATEAGHATSADTADTAGTANLIHSPSDNRIEGKAYKEGANNPNYAYFNLELPIQKGLYIMTCYTKNGSSIMYHTGMILIQNPEQNSSGVSNIGELTYKYLTATTERSAYGQVTFKPNISNSIEMGNPVLMRIADTGA